MGYILLYGNRFVEEILAIEVPHLYVLRDAMVSALVDVLCATRWSRATYGYGEEVNNRTGRSNKVWIGTWKALNVFEIMGVHIFFWKFVIEWSKRKKNVKVWLSLNEGRGSYEVEKKVHVNTVSKNGIKCRIYHRESVDSKWSLFPSSLHPKSGRKRKKIKKRTWINARKLAEMQIGRDELYVKLAAERRQNSFIWSITLHKNQNRKLGV